MTRATRLAILGAVLAAVLAACARTPGTPPLAADPGSDRIVALGEPVVLDGSASSGAITSYLWTLDARPTDSSAELTGSETSTATFVPDRPGEYHATLVVAGVSGTASASVTLTAVASGGVLLEGDPATDAADATFDLEVPLEVEGSHIEVDPVSGRRLLRSEIVVEFDDDATVGDVNTLLGDLDGVIVVMVRRVATVVVAIPDPGSSGALEALLDAVRARPTVADAWSSWLIDGPPEGPMDDAAVGVLASPPLTDPTRLDHHQAVRAPGAWNARDALPVLAERPWVLIADWFGDGVPTDGYGVQVPATDFASGIPWDHGYHVLGIVAAAYGVGASTPARADATGIFPRTLRTRAIDLAAATTEGRLELVLVQRMNAIVNVDADARIVVNTSLGYTDAPFVPESAINRDARTYVKAIRANDLERRVVHATAAGNTVCTVATRPCPIASVLRYDAALTSQYAFAVLGDLRTSLGFSIAPLEGVLVVENRANTGGGALQRPLPTCADDSSIMGGNLSAIGTSVWSLGSRNTAAGASDQTGTSMATPQAAGLAAFVWALDPTLDAAGVVAVLRGTARGDYATNLPGNATNGICNTVAPQPVIDALDAVLAAGGDAARLAMVDVTGPAGLGVSDGRFDERDLAVFVQAFQAAAVLDFGRFDLNGDGVTDGALSSTYRARFDLDGDGVFGLITRSYAGVDVDLDEAALSDADVLCALAYGPLYTGSDSERNRRVGQPCGLVDVRILDPTEGDTFAEGEAIGLVVEVTLNGPFAGDVILSTGRVERDRVSGYTYLDRGPVTTLATRHVCADDPFVEVAFVDSTTGLRAVDTVRVAIVPSGVDVSIGGPRPRDVRVYRPSPGAEPEIAPFGLTGKASHPSCTDPFSTSVDQGTISWTGSGGAPALASGPSLTLDGAYLQSLVGGVFMARDVELRGSVDGVFDMDTLTLRPCTSSLGLSDGASAVEGYPECPLDGVIGSVLEALRSMFGTIDPADVERIISFHIHGVARHQAVLEALGLEPCDPTVCDPFPPDFPHAQADLRAGFYGDRGLVITGYLDWLFELLGPADPDGFETQVRELALEVASDTQLGDADRTLFAAAMSVARTTARFVAPLDAGGEDGWRRIGLAGDPQTLHARVDRLAPARRAVEGLLTIITGVDGYRDQPDAALAVDAAVYAASLEALAQALLAAEGGP